MAPILSKVQEHPPRTHKEAAERAYRKARPLLEGFLVIVKEVIEGGGVAYNVASEKLSELSDKAVTVSLYILENFCCVDFKKFARGPEPKLAGSLPIMFCLSLLALLYHAFVFVYMPAAGIAFTSKTSMIFHAFTFLCLASFVQATRVDPGGIPTSPRWRTPGSPPEACRETKREGEARWCRKSNAYKPDRAHFCRVMNRAVLRMDHHCPWLSNTIGFANHKFFYLFLLYSCGACGILNFNILSLLMSGASLPAMSSFLLIGAEGLNLLLTGILAPFFLFHTWLLARNMTTIEFCSKAGTKATPEEKENGTRWKSKYDLGLYNNLCAVLGDNPLLWLLPVGEPSGDGITFLRREDLLAPEPMHSRLRQGLERAAAAALAKAEGSRLPRPPAEPEAEDADDLEQADAAAGGAGALGEGEEYEDWQEDWEEGEEEAFETDSTAKTACSVTSISRQQAESFLGWTSANEFVDDLRVGCITIEESVKAAALTVSELCGACAQGKGKARVSRGGLAGDLKKWSTVERSGRGRSGYSSGSDAGAAFFSS